MKLCKIIKIVTYIDRYLSLNDKITIFCLKKIKPYFCRERILSRNWKKYIIKSKCKQPFKSEKQNLFSRTSLGQDRLGQARLGQVRLGQARLGQVRLGQARLGQVRIGQDRLGQDRSDKNPSFVLRNWYTYIVLAES